MAELDILTIEDARVAVGLGLDRREHDTLLASMVTAVSAKVDEAIGPVIIRTVTDELHDGGYTEVLLKKRPVASITSVTEYAHTTPTTLTATTNATKPDDGYLLKDGGILERRAAGARRRFTAGDGNVAVTYEAGRYATTADVDELYVRAAGITLKAWWAMEDVTTSPLGEYETPSSRWAKFALANATVDLVANELLSRVPMG